ncbi:activator of Hsp90 ATPase 1 family protein [Methylophaga lonarensis MPL]|uniref:Activator of Hsp90 ATPase 1 family protein n=1 Tax=Methylophaga lonarensis MPL TaxID=1286106 RepID=M7P388_9GAMM|nr:activator of Hsp90 ATPase 1 family protein [Methylophaga lonarensis]EMR13977.1 activator of Hsp90 ATPase 1 family protein [Methylophaga lonarensis MPL]
MANIEHIQYVNAPLSFVYEALTTAHGLAEVWTQDLQFIAQIDAVNEFRFGDEHPTKMKVTELVRDSKMTWHCVDSDPEWIDTTSVSNSIVGVIRQRSSFGTQTGVKLPNSSVSVIIIGRYFC